MVKSFKEIAKREEVQANEAWIYKHFYNEFYKSKKGVTSIIQQPFDGRTIKVRSLQNPDTNPSLCFYFKSGKYLWKDFSGEGGGDAVDFVAHHIGKYRGPAIERINLEFERFLETGSDWEFSAADEEPIQNNTTITAETDMMSDKSLEYWNSYKISKELLEEYQVKSLRQYIVAKHGVSPSVWTNTGYYLYGYYSKDKGLYQIYQPYHETYKYITVRSDYVMGLDQLKYESQILVIVSGLKDLMAFKATCTNLKFDAIAPSSESCMLRKDFINYMKTRYKYILTILDNDPTGMKYMLAYRTMYNIPLVNIGLGKDLAANNRKYARDYLSMWYANAIDKALR